MSLQGERTFTLRKCLDLLLFEDLFSRKPSSDWKYKRLKMICSAILSLCNFLEECQHQLTALSLFSWNVESILGIELLQFDRKKGNLSFGSKLWIGRSRHYNFSTVNKTSMADLMNMPFKWAQEVRSRMMDWPKFQSKNQAVAIP